MILIGRFDLIERLSSILRLERVGLQRRMSLSNLVAPVYNILEAQRISLLCDNQSKSSILTTGTHFIYTPNIRNQAILLKYILTRRLSGDATFGTVLIRHQTAVGSATGKVSYLNSFATTSSDILTKVDPPILITRLDELGVTIAAVTTSSEIAFYIIGDEYEIPE